MAPRVWLAVAVVVTVAGCHRQASDGSRQVGSADAGAAATQAERAGAHRVGVGELATKEPAHYLGQRVTVEGPVANVLSESALAIGEEGVGQGQGLLVLVPDRSEALPQRGRVVVTGTVVRYDRDQLRRQYGAMATTPEIDARYAGQGAIGADSLRGPDGREVAGGRGRDGALPAGSGEPASLGRYPGTDPDRQQPGGEGKRYVAPRDRQPPGLPPGSRGDRP